MATASFLRPMPARSPAPVKLCLERTGAVLASVVEGAFDSASRMRDFLDEQGGTPCAA